MRNKNLQKTFEFTNKINDFSIVTIDFLKDVMVEIKNKDVATFFLKDDRI